MSILKGLVPRTPMHLAYDERVSVEAVSGGKVVDYRARVWLAHGCRPTALVSAVEGGPGPSWAIKRTAHLVWSRFLGHTIEEWYFFTIEKDMKGRDVLLVHELFWDTDGSLNSEGRSKRCVPNRVRTVPERWETFHLLVGTPDVLGPPV